MRDQQTSRFAVATRDELWSAGCLLERRLTHGEAIESQDGIRASDARDDTLIHTVDREMDRMRSAVTDLLDAAGPRIRLVADARPDGIACTIAIRRNRHSIITTPELVNQDDELLRSIASIEPEGSAVDYRGVPILWRNGSASVLLHEAAGHAVEHGHAVLRWPAWLEVRDGSANLLEGEPPSQFRRESFRDVPLRRMANLVVRQTGAPFDIPDERIEVLLIDGGLYEPLIESVVINVGAADLIAGGAIRRLPPFSIVESRATVSRSIIGAAGEPIRYPGVVCSREGQEIVVGSAAPLMLTVFE